MIKKSRGVLEARFAIITAKTEQGGYMSEKESHSEEILASERFLFRPENINRLAQKHRPPPKRHGSLMALDRAQACRDLLQRLPREKLPLMPPSSLTANSKPVKAPGTSSEPYIIPVLADPKKLVLALDILRTLKSFPPPQP